MAKSAIPGLTSWSRMAGGSSGGGKYGYDYRVNGQTFTISPYTTQYGRFAGYQLTVYPGLPARGHHRIGSFRSPSKAVSAARIWAVQSGLFKGLADNPRLSSKFVPARVRQLKNGRLEIRITRPRKRTRR